MGWYLIAAMIVVLLAGGLFLLKDRAAKNAALRVLMYHKVSADGTRDFLTVPVEDLRRQFNHLLAEGYTPVLLSDLVKFVQHKQALPLKPVLITFDDGYRDNYTVMYPLLKELGMKANIFLVPTYVMEAEANRDPQYLNLQELQKMDKALVEFGLHSYQHRNYKELTTRQVDDDLIQAQAWLTAHSIPFQPCLAFPYGAYPKKNPVRRAAFFDTLGLNKIVVAFRIGNRVNPLPLRNPLLVQRLDIRGDAPAGKFERLILHGKR